MIGGACGCGASDMLRRNALIRRYQITGGACAGLAVAFNAPFTGMMFAFEEGQKRFTPEVFVCAFSSVVFAVLVRNLLYAAFGMDVGAYFTTFSFAAADGTQPVSCARSRASDFTSSYFSPSVCSRGSRSGRASAR